MLTNEKLPKNSYYAIQALESANRVTSIPSLTSENQE